MRIAFLASVTLTIFVIISLSIFAQTQNREESGCNQVDRNKPLLSISFEQFTDDKNVLLRLHNNTNCPIHIYTNNDVSIFRVINLPGGKTKLERRKPEGAYNLSEGEILSDMIFEVYDYRNSKRILTTQDGHLIYGRVIPAATSILFSVPRSYFRKYMNITVSYEYVWETKVPLKMRGYVEHNITFPYFEFPEGVLKK